MKKAAGAFALAATIVVLGSAIPNRAQALPISPGAIADIITGTSNVEDARYVCWWTRGGRRVCEWRPGRRYWHRRHWRRW